MFVQLTTDQIDQSGSFQLLTIPIPLKQSRTKFNNQERAMTFEKILWTEIHRSFKDIP